MNKRRELFSSLAFIKKQENIDVRPPYFKSEDLFNICKECSGECAKACPEDIIIIKDDGSPILEFKKSGCTYCDECAIACKFDVLKIEDKKLINVKFEIDMLKCLSWQKTMCFSCKEICLEEAINFLGLFRAEIDYKKCTNCGFCLKVCPTNAIRIKKWQ